LIEIYFLEIENLIWTDIDNNLLNHISEERKNKVFKFYNIIDRKLCLYSALLTRMICCKKLSLSNKDLGFYTLKYKPLLINDSSIHFSISHSQNLIAVSFSENNIGLDIERIQDAPFYLINYIFHPYECEYINKNNNLNELRFFEIWTKKEAFGKYTGSGLDYNLEEFNTISKKVKKNFYTSVYKNYILSIYSKNISTIKFINITEIDIFYFFTKKHIL